MSLDSKLIDVFCSVYGEKYRGQIKPETSMDDIPEWDSESFLDLVLAIEEAFGVSFADDEVTQMFQLGHIARILEAARLNIPHDDVANACCVISNLRRASNGEFNVIVLSGSSTREGMLRPREAEALLKESVGSKARFYNASTSGLVLAETVQLLDLTGGRWSGMVLVGTSPIIYAGCGVAEFNRAARLKRFPFASPRMSNILNEYGYSPTVEEKNVPISLDLWLQRYLKDRDLSELQHEPYIYPTLAPWPPNQFSDVTAILRYYNHSVLNFEQSMRINAELYETIADWSIESHVPVAFVDLTLHSEVKSYLEGLGRIVSRYEIFIAEFCRRRSIPLIDAVKNSGIADHDFRDPAHIFQKRESYTRAIFEGVKQAAGESIDV